MPITPEQIEICEFGSVLGCPVQEDIENTLPGANGKLAA
ncbi:hypothetical protein XBP1_3010030 [Xenorhabdus bovienii str. puntauvense]|uniref:Uncharacterized protein n=2 Tax=Xenorhabdus bovienii TaxID=40576 RepID=A0A077N830_XENBV|nr:hypothetical protein XBP1_3010030 [Xenorhabdus bovienii str. puntauvense]CDH00694.1 hypothetical protein XBFM1_1740057 [Xenorhabdus bovienii str. feltiae Moldova]